jgi:hypothetical protein
VASSGNLKDDGKLWYPGSVLGGAAVKDSRLKESGSRRLQQRRSVVSTGEVVDGKSERAEREGNEARTRLFCMYFIPDSAVDDVEDLGSTMRGYCFANQLCCGIPLFSAVRSSASMVFLGFWLKVTHARTEAKKDPIPPAKEAIAATMVTVSLAPLKATDTAIASKQSNTASTMSDDTLAEHPL